MSIDDFARAVIAHALRDGDLHEDCTLCAEKIDDALRAVPAPAVYVVVGHVAYESDDIQSVHSTEQAALVERDRLAAVRHNGMRYHDSYTVERHEVKR